MVMLISVTINVHVGGRNSLPQITDALTHMTIQYLNTSTTRSLINPSTIESQEILWLNNELLFLQLQPPADISRLRDLWLAIL